MDIPAPSPHPPDIATNDRGMLRQDRSISLLRANYLMVFFAVPAVLLPVWVYGLAWHWLPVRFVTGTPALWLLAAVLVGIVTHELLHAWAWAMAARRPVRSMRFGFDWKTITPYAHCPDAMPARAYRIGAVTPLLVLGVLPTVAALASGSPALLGFGLFFTFAAGGDMLILWLLRGTPAGALVEDHPHRAGCYVLTPADPSILTQHDAPGSDGSD